MSKIKLGEIAEIQSGPFGTQLHKREYVSCGIPMLNAKNIGNGVVITDSMDYVSETICNRLPQYVLNKGDILFGRAGSIERHTYIDSNYEGCFQGTNCIRIRCKSPEIALYVSYYLWLPQLKQTIENQTGGSILSYITTDLLKEIMIEIPDTKTVNEVAKTLYLLDQKIALNNKINDNLEQQAKLIYEDMMAKAISNKLGGKHTIAKELTEVVTGKEDANFSDPNGIYKFFTCSKIPLQCNDYAFDSSSILIAGNGDFNVKHYSGKFNAYQRTYVLTPKKEYYSLLYLASSYRINSFKLNSSGSIVKFITKSDIESIPIFIPDDNSYLQRMNKLILLQEFNNIECETLIHLRDWLLPMLMNGQASIAD